MDPSHYPSYSPEDSEIGTSGAGSQTNIDDGIPPTTPEWAAIDPMAAAASAALKKEKGRVRFNSNAGATGAPELPHVPRPSSQERRNTPPTKPRPSALRGGSSGSIPTLSHFRNGSDVEPEGAPDADVHERVRDRAQERARERAQQVADKLQRGSPTGSRNSIESFGETAISDGDAAPHEMGIPLQSLDSTGKHTDTDKLIEFEDEPLVPAPSDEAQSLVRTHTRFEKKRSNQGHTASQEEKGESSSHVVPYQTGGSLYDDLYSVPPPENYRGGVLSQLLKLYKPSEIGTSPHSGSGGSSHGGSTSYLPFSHKRTRSMSSTGPNSGSTSGNATPSRRKWYEQNRSQETLANLIEASARLANPNMGQKDQAAAGSDDKQKKNKKRPGHKRTSSASRLANMWQKEEARITVHIAETLSRQGYIIKLCRALMLFGAPTHRLEEYLSMTARILEIDGQFLYLPGCMIISFDDKSTHTTEVRIVRVTQGIDLGKLKDAHHVYKEVMHDVIGVEEATERLENLISAKVKYSAWLRVLAFGLTSATAAPFSFKARLIDLPLIFCFGCVVGILQLIVAPKSNLYNNVFEVSATVLISFMARAFGSINNGKLFCFSSLAQSGIVMLLPGYSVLCSSLELQSRAMVPGSIRIVYAIVYSLLLGFGITIGAALWGVIDADATSATQCDNPLNPHLGFIFVPFFIVCIAVLYQAKWKQMPVMVVIAFSGYIVNFFSGQRFKASPQIANTLGALCVGVLANLYSRLQHGVAAAVLIPAIFVQVPGGLASTGGLLSGIRTANALTNQTHGNSTEQEYNVQGQLSGVVFDVAGSMVQIAIGIAVGLFMSALLIYPFGKRRSGLFSF